MFAAFSSLVVVAFAFVAVPVVAVDYATNAFIVFALPFIAVDAFGLCFFADVVVIVVFVFSFSVVDIACIGLSFLRVAVCLLLFLLPLLLLW